MGVILFIMVIGRLPFNDANPKTDRYYKAIKDNQAKAWWRAFEKVRDKDLPPLTDEFKQLVVSLL